MTFSQTARQVLITSNAGNGYENVGSARHCDQENPLADPDKWEISGESFSPDGKVSDLHRERRWQHRHLLYDIASGKSAPSLPLPKGVN
jgi:hypothetical protein